MLCLLPHGLWLLTNFDAVASGALGKLSAGDQDDGYLRNVASGLGSMLLGVLAFITPLWFIYGLICGRYCKRAAVDWHNPDARFFIALYLAFLLG